MRRNSALYGSIKGHVGKWPLMEPKQEIDSSLMLVASLPGAQNNMLELSSNLIISEGVTGIHDLYTHKKVNVSVNESVHYSSHES